MTITNEVIVEMCKAAFPGAENDIEAVDLYSHEIYKKAQAAQGKSFYELSELYLLMRAVRKNLFENRAKLYTVSVN